MTAPCTLPRIPADVPLGPWTYRATKGLWIVSRPGSLFELYRASEASAQRTCEEENARWRKQQLEAAAPDLLDACRTLLRGSGPKAIRKAQEAIAKAEGRHA